MSTYEFGDILEKFLPYKKHLKYLSIFGWGEPLLDKGLEAKVRIAKINGFPSVGFASNCTELTYRRGRALLEAGLDTLICSVDGIRKETHESIRVGTDFHQVVKNIWQFLEIRPRFGHTKVIIRFIRQKSNALEWPDFKRRWEKRLDPSYGDSVISFDVVEAAGKVQGYENKDVRKGEEVPLYCSQLHERITIMSNGDVALCCADDNADFHLGNILEGDDPMKIYNGSVFKRYRKLLAAGERKGLIPCETCTIPRSDLRKDRV
jgi:hypothetical protein